MQNAKPRAFPAGSTAPIRCRLKFAGQCIACGTSLARGTEAFYYVQAHRVRCVSCPTVPKGVEAGVAGASTRREHKRLIQQREARLQERFDFAGGLVLASREEPH